MTPTFLSGLVLALLECLLYSVTYSGGHEALAVLNIVSAVFSCSAKLYSLERGYRFFRIGQFELIGLDERDLLSDLLLDQDEHRHTLRPRPPHPRYQVDRKVCRVRLQVVYAVPQCLRQVS